MDAFIAGIVIVVVTGVLVAIVRRWTAKPLPKGDIDAVVALDVSTALAQAWPDIDA